MDVLFPFEVVKPGSRIILYGASGLGYKFYRQIVTSGYCQLVAWVDKQYDWYRRLNLPVDPPETVLSCNADSFVIAAEKESVYKSIFNSLANYGIPPEKIYWRNDYGLKADIVAKYDAARICNEAQNAVEVNPIRLISPSRMDIVVRVIYARELLENINNGEGYRLYAKIMERVNGFHEDVDNFFLAYFSDYTGKSGQNSFLASFRDLLKSMQEVGFRRESFIPINKHGQLINGAHRCAAALALGIRAFVRKYPCDGMTFDYSAAWLRRNGISEQEISYIERYYCELMAGN